MSIKITTSGNEKKLIERLKLEHINFQINQKTLRDNFFLNLAKLFDRTKSKKIKSVLKLIETLKKNHHLFDNSDWEILSIIIESFEKCIKDYQHLINAVIEHRNQCLAHPDKIEICTHLNEITTIQTKEIIDCVIDFTNKLSDHFDVPKFEIEKLESLKEKMQFDFYYRIKKME